MKINENEVSAALLMSGKVSVFIAELCVTSRPKQVLRVYSRFSLIITYIVTLKR